MTRNEVLSLIPEIDLIKSEDLREKSIACWKQVIEIGKWKEKGIMNAPLAAGVVSDDCPEKSIDHCRRVVRLCKTVYDEIGPWANEIGTIDYDTLICGAVLHDIGKFVEYDYVDGHAEHSFLSKYYTHVLSGAYIAKANGIPDEIVHIILQHSDLQSPPSNYESLELMMIKKIDHLCFSIAAMQYPLK